MQVYALRLALTVGRPMRIASTKPLFAWDCLEDSPTLKTIEQLLDVIPDDALLESLRTAGVQGPRRLSGEGLVGRAGAGDRPAAYDH
jgi:hypothetical protein